ncbi:hypothetical protein FA95DRAFT_1613597 [Auriscalpium vulgare]|uniref:Uncharacterized protein n=1 Tax=Auriscalpium vulgare TaxID=40419 RepID=A0ACB8R2L7_9AGAM|nr:hypothetical protein FA95DRAFT_1613597 [Auriscalpium vulgare]
MSADASSIIPDGTTYWADACAVRITQLGATPQYTIPLANSLRVVEDREVFLNATIATIIQDFREEERALQAAIASIKCRYQERLDAAKDAQHAAMIQHNILIPMNRLPADVLERIFVLLVAQDPPKRMHLGWIRRATHVCRAWRQVALGYPRLWSTMVFPLWCRDWTTMMFARSGTHPLTMTTGDPIHGDDDTESTTDSESVLDSDSSAMNRREMKDEARIAAHERKLILQNLPRTRNLRVASRFTELNYLDIFGSTCHMLERYESESGYLPKVLGPHTPALRELCVRSSLGFSWNYPHLTSLVTFKLINTSWGGYFSPRRNAIADCLRRMPALETLRIDSNIRNDAVDAAAQTAAAHLPQLRNFSLTTRFEDAQFLFERIDIPCSTSLHISFQENEKGRRAVEVPQKDIQVLTAFFSALRPLLHGNNSDDAPIVKLVITSLCPWSETVTAATGVKICAWRGDDRAYTPPVLLELPRGSRRWGGGTLALTAVRAFASEHLRALAVLDVAWDEATWATALEAAPAVQSIESVGGAAFALCRVLAGRLSAPMSDTPAQGVVLPELESLKLRDVSFNARYVRRALDRKDAAPRLRVGDFLLEMLAARARAGFPLYTLDIRRCSPVSPFHISQLRAALPDVRIVEPCGYPPGPPALLWGSSNSGDSANTRILEGRRGGMLLVCALPPADSVSEEIVVLDELEVRDDRYEPQEIKTLTMLGYLDDKSDEHSDDGDEEDED